MPVPRASSWIVPMSGGDGLPVSGIWGSANAANLIATNANPIPIVWGVAKINNVLLAQLNSWNPQASPYDAWQPGQTYYPGNRVQSNGNIYEAALPYLVTPSTAYGGGSWISNTTFAQFAIIINNGNYYGCLQGGLTAYSGTGPSGTGPVVIDGYAIWMYLGTANVSIAPAQPISQPTQWMPYQAYAGTYPLISNGGRIYQSASTIAGRSAASGTGPSGTSSSIADGSMSWRYMCQTSFLSNIQTTAWVGNTAYAAGNTTYTGGSQYICVSAGTSSAASPPTGTSGGTPYTDGTVTWNWIGFETLSGPPAVWKASTYYAVNQQVICGPSIYKCTTTGTSGTSGPFLATIPLTNNPFGTGSSITDGTAVWQWVSAASGGPSHTKGYAADGTAVWNFISAVPDTNSSGGVYFPSFVSALAEGPVYGVLRTWWDKHQYTSLASKALSFFAATNNGTAPYSLNGIGLIVGGAYYVGGTLENTATAAFVHTCSDTSTDPPSLAFEVQGVFASSQATDVNPADIFADIITSAERGAGLSSSLVDASITGSAVTSFRTYCDSMGFHLSLVLDEQYTALDLLSNLLLCANSDALYSQGAIKVIPLGDTAITSPVFGSVNYTPNVTPVANLGYGDFTANPPVDVQRAAPEDTFNSMPVEFIDRSAEYSDSTVEDPEMSDVDVRGLWRGGVTQLYATFPDATAPLMLSKIMAQRQVYCRNTYTFEVSWRYIYLEPGDLVTLTEPQLGLVNQLVRITNLLETAEGRLTFTAEDFVVGVQHVVPSSPQLNLGSHPHFPTPVSLLPLVVGGGGALGYAPGSITKKGTLGAAVVTSSNLDFSIYSDVALTGPTTTTNTNDTYTLPFALSNFGNSGAPYLVVYVGGVRRPPTTSVGGTPTTVWTLSGTSVVFALGYIPQGEDVRADYAA